jgi:protein tyrosine phosphatase
MIMERSVEFDYSQEMMVVPLQMVDIPKSLMFLRSQRMHLVQTLGQYRFLYIVIIQYIKNARLI